MPNSSIPLRFAVSTVAAPGSAVAPSLPIPDNCGQVIIYNWGAVEVLYGIGAPGFPLTAGVNAARIPAGGAVSLVIGLLADRGVMDQSVTPGSGIVYDAVGITTVDTTYICALGQS